MTEYNVRRFDPSGTPLVSRTDASEASASRSELVAALARQDPSFNPDGKTDAYLQGRLDSINAGTLPLSRELEQAAGNAQRNLWRQPSPFAAPTPTSTPRREDANQSFSADDARQASHEASRNAWRT